MGYKLETVLLLTVLGSPGFSYDNTTGWWETHPQENMVEDYVTSSGGSDSSPYDPKARLLSIFTFVNFANLECTVGDLSGFCVSLTECKAFGGTKIGTCSRDYGTCCYKAITCGGTSSMNITYMQNPDYGGYTTSQQLCIFSITRASNVCQLRLDFNRFELNNPEYVVSLITPPAQRRKPNNGKCLTDQFRVNSGYSTKSLKYLCGKAPANWHFYVDTRDAANPTTFHFDLKGSGNRIWNVKVTMVDCDLFIPQACGQYFTGTSGILQTFNWDNGMYLHGFNYAICLRKEKGYCGYTITDLGPSFIVCPDMFVIPNDMTPTNGAVRQASYCLPIPNNNPPSLISRYPTTFTSTLRSPHYFYFFTDLIDADNQNRGRETCTVTQCRAPGTTNGFYFSWKATKC